MAEIDATTLNTLVGKMLGDLGGAMSVPTARIGIRLGLFETLHNAGPATAGELAHRAGGLAERYVREWALAQEVGEALGAQAGEAKLTEALTGAGFSQVRRATEGPFNIVLEARP